MDVQLLLAVLVIAALICLAVWLYRNKDKMEIPFLIKFSGPYKDIDIRKNRELNKVGDWVRIGEGSYRAQCKISEEKLKSLVYRKYPDIPKKDVIVYNTLNGYTGLG